MSHPGAVVVAAAAAAAAGPVVVVALHFFILYCAVEYSIMDHKVRQW